MLMREVERGEQYKLEAAGVDAVFITFAGRVSDRLRVFIQGRCTVDVELSAGGRVIFNAIDLPPITVLYQRLSPNGHWLDRVGIEAPKSVQITRLGRRPMPEAVA